MKKITLLFFLAFYSFVVFAYEIPDHDQRNAVIRHTDMNYKIADYGNLAAWEKRSQRLRQQLLFSAGLMPWPKKTTLNSEIFDRIE